MLEHIAAIKNIIMYSTTVSIHNVNKTSPHELIVNKTIRITSVTSSTITDIISKMWTWSPHKVVWQSYMEVMTEVYTCSSVQAKWIVLFHVSYFYLIFTKLYLIPYIDTPVQQDIFTFMLWHVTAGFKGFQSFYCPSFSRISTFFK